MLARLAHVVARNRWKVIGAWIVLTLFGGFAAGQVSKRWYQSFSIPGKSAYEANQRTLNTFGTGVRPPDVVVFHTAGDATKSGAIEAAMKRAAAVLPGSRTSSYFSTHNLMYVSKDRHTTFEEVYPAGLAKFNSTSKAKEVRAAAGRGLWADCALLMIFAFRDELREGEDVETALVETMTHSGRSVIVSGSTVAVGLLSMVILPLPFIRSIGIGGMLIPAVSVLAAITLLPALLATLGTRINSLRVMPRRFLDHGHPEDGLWGRWAALVMRRPVPVAAVGLAIVGLLVYSGLHLNPSEAQQKDFPGSGDAI